MVDKAMVKQYRVVTRRRDDGTVFRYAREVTKTNNKGMEECMLRLLTARGLCRAQREALKAGGSNAKEQAARKAILDVVKRETASADVCQKVVLQDLQALLTAETG